MFKKKEKVAMPVALRFLTVKCRSAKCKVQGQISFRFGRAMTTDGLLSSLSKCISICLSMWGIQMSHIGTVSVQNRTLGKNKPKLTFFSDDVYQDVDDNERPRPPDPGA